MDDLTHDLAAYEEPEIDLHEPPPTLAGQEQADRFLRRIRLLEERKDEVAAVGTGERERIRRWEEERTAVLDGQIRWLATSVEQFMRAHHAAGGGVTLKLPHGELKLRPSQYSVVVRDGEAFVKWAEEVLPDAVTRPDPPAPKPDAKFVRAQLGEALTVIPIEERDLDGKVLYRLAFGEEDEREFVPGVLVSRLPEDKAFSITKPRRTTEAPEPEDG